jgi:hypothetical protein
MRGSESCGRSARCSPRGGQSRTTTPVAAAPADNEQLIEMVRDEHKLLVQYFKTEQAKEQAIREQEAKERNKSA